MAWRQGNKDYKNLDPQKGVSTNIQMMIQNFCLILTLKWRKLAYIKEMDPVIKAQLFVSLVRLVSRV